jgi:hypothetical protein
MTAKRASAQAKSNDVFGQAWKPPKMFRSEAAVTSATSLLLEKVCDIIEDVSLVFTFASYFTASL